jgi:predicted AAA+ superfamily ATPase
MILKETLREVILSQRKELESYDSGVERQILKYIDLSIQYATVISGIRRCGKSTFLHQLLQKLTNFYYLNFEDTRLIDFDVSDFEKLEEVLVEEFGPSDTYMFDEIQNTRGWEIFVRSGLDKQKKFVITGSNASLLSRELGTRLTGRHINVDLFPFSFPEYLNFKNERPSLITFKEYNEEGGFPIYLKSGKPEILRQLLIDIVQRDIVARYNLRSSKIMMEMALYLLTNTGKEFSYSNLGKTYGLGSTNTAVSFVSYLEDSYLLFTVQRFDYSLRKQQVSPRKVYSVDNGLSSANSMSFSSDNGRMLENTVFLHLRRLHREIFYFRKNRECDFLVKERNGIRMAIQVTFELREDNKVRELGGLLEAMEEFQLSEGLIITFDQEDEFVQNHKRILVKPAWKWIMESVP